MEAGHSASLNRSCGGLTELIVHWQEHRKPLQSAKDMKPPAPRTVSNRYSEPEFFSVAKIGHRHRRRLGPRALQRA